MSQLEDRLSARENTLKSGLEARLSAREAELKTTGPDAFSEAIQRTTADNLLQAVPSALAMASAGVQTPFSDRGFSEIFQEEKNLFPANIMPSMNQLEAAGAAFRGEFGRRPVDVEGVENPVPLFKDRIGPRFDEELALINERQASLQEQHPGATQAGEFGGDVLAFMTGRLPLAKGINVAESALMTKKFATALADPTVLRTVKRTLNSKALRSLARGAGRAIETGTEAAIFSALKDSDNPLESAAFAAGSQVAGSALIKFGEGLLTGGPLKIGGKILLASGSFGALIQMTKQTIPGGDPDSVREFLTSMTEGFSKVQLALALGALSTVVGAGRLRGGKLAEEMPKALDFIAAIPRVTSIALITSYFNAPPEEQQLIDDTLEQLQKDPDFFGPEITKKLMDAMESGNLVDALKEQL